MRKMLTILFLSALSVAAHSQTTNPNYDEALAKKVGADDYGMKKYVFVVLKTGKNTTMDTMVKAGQLIVAGPFGKNTSDFRGLFILNVATIEEAQALLQTDPAIKADLLSPELYSWYGSAALSEYLDASDKVWKKGF